MNRSHKRHRRKRQKYLKITRLADEAVRIGKAIVVKIIRVGENRVELGIEAPGYEVTRPEAVAADLR